MTTSNSHYWTRSKERLLKEKEEMTTQCVDTGATLPNVVSPSPDVSQGEDLNRLYIFVQPCLNVVEDVPVWRQSGIKKIKKMWEERMMRMNKHVT